MAPGGRQVGGGSLQDEDAKNMFDRIGKFVHDKVKEEAKTYIEELKAGVSFTSIFGEETVSTADPCELVEDYRRKNTGTADAHGDPCKKDTNGNDVDRFSVKEQAEYDNKKMKCSNGDACAPFRRLHLCNKNFPNMNSNDSSKAKHDLLAEVCMAAKFEGESLKTYRAQYDEQYPSSGSSFTMCTMLARSFADIGDIIRGRDLYSGNSKEKKQRKQLEKNLKEIFGKIYNELTKEKRSRYNGDTTNYYQLREDWWNANRETVWKAMTCSDDLKDASYFRATCSMNGSGAQAKNKCTCINGDPPTYFDYVPQFLRWFEEWAEDFCRKKKKKLENVKKQCRGVYEGKERYCSLNGYDCEKTVRARGKLRYGNRCIDCLYACNPYVEWIDNQRKQFLKQKERYDNVINGASVSRRQKPGASTTNYDGYEKKFYEELNKSEYRTVDAFLEKLSKEKACTAITDGGKIDFKQVNSGSASDS
ncbi:hypothetical protein PFFCH_05305, partial [Plasmodium falciparum FCH/4]